MDHNPGVIHLSRGDLAFDGQDFALLHTPAPGNHGGSDTSAVLTANPPGGSQGSVTGVGAQTSSEVAQTDDSAGQTSNLPTTGTLSDPSQLPPASSGDTSSTGDLTTGLSGDTLASTSALDQVFAQL
jgi:hypothetical protein